MNLFPESKKKEKIKNIFNLSKKAGALSGKLLGAGKGGFFLFFVEEKFQKKFIEKMKPYTVVKHNITNTPCKVIFNANSSVN